MSESTQPAHDADDDAQSHDYPVDIPDDKLASHENVKHEKQRKREQRKWVTFELSDGTIAPYQYRALTEQEQDDIAQANTEVKPTRTGQPETEEMDMSGFRTDLIKTCVTKGPPGFKATDREINAIDDDIRQELADAIVDFSEMEEHERHSFR